MGYIVTDNFLTAEGRMGYIGTTVLLLVNNHDKLK